jgi:hypothetical protein
VLIIASDIAFASATVFEMKRLFVSEAEQQPIVNLTMLLIEIGLALVLIILAVFMVWRLVDLFKRKGRWATELAEEGLDAPRRSDISLTTPLGSNPKSEAEVQS